MPPPDLAIAGAYDLAQFRTLMRTGRPPDGRDLGLMKEVAERDFANYSRRGDRASSTPIFAPGRNGRRASSYREACPKSATSPSSSAAFAAAPTADGPRKALIALAPAQLAFDIVEIGSLPLYNQDLDPKSPPAEWVAFREQVGAADGVLFVTPEYNRSVPGVLKNAIDVGSRPYGRSAWSKKPAAVVSVTPGALGAFGANHHLRQSAVFLDMPMMQMPEAYLSNVGALFDAEGKLIDEKTEKFLGAFMSAYADWVEKILRGPGELA